MGIRFYCPNGHKLNVKAHLAGKAGFCPECGVRLVIPYQSTRKSSRELGNKEQTQSLEDSNPKFSVTPSSLFIEEMKTKESGITAEAAIVEKTPSNETLNPILQDQTVVWYIQVPGGPQYGPATGQIVHAWIQENRISPTMLIWREGWANWLEAKDVFPELQ